jgi:uncharacterized membrane protein
MTLLVLMLGLYALLINRQTRLGLITLALAGLWAFLAGFVIPPLFAGTDNIHWGRYAHLGQTVPDMALNLLTRPGLFIDHLAAVDALTYLQRLLTPAAFLALLNPVTLLLALPSLGINLLSNFEAMQEVNALIYAAPVVPAVLISSIYGAANVQRLSHWAMQRFSNSANDESSARSLPLGLSPRSSAPPLPRPPTPPLLPHSLNPINLILGAVILSAALAYHGHYGYLPWGGKFRGWEQITDHHRRAARILAAIPPEAKLSAQDRLNPHAARRLWELSEMMCEGVTPLVEGVAP